MAKRKSTSSNATAKRAKSTKRRSSFRRGRTSSARPMRSLKTNYRSTNVYRFSRETIPQTLSFSLIPAGTSFPVMGYLNFDNLQFNQLSQATNDFGNLFARYKIDKIETFLTPMFQETAATNNNIGYSTGPGLRITRINTKWLDEAFAISADADDQLAVLAQFQSKSVSNYASHRSLKITTINPGVATKGVVDSTGAELDTRAPCPWLNASLEGNVPLKHNSLIFAERTDGLAMDASWKYRVVHKLYFRCSQVS